MFNSRNPVYRCPTGAVPAKTQVHFKITLPRDLRCSATRLLLQRDSDGGTDVYGMFWCGMNGEAYEWWECDYTPASPGLFFYYFELDTWRGKLQLTRAFGSEGSVENKGGRWQLTVYAPYFSTPDWLAGGVMYQIFPDRFYRSEQKKENVPPDRKLHETWGEQPDWEPDEKGTVTNSDYFGGDLRGMEKKLDYLKSLGVTCIYMNPIFEAHSNHRYNTANYAKIDPLLGTEEDFTHLSNEARKRGIRILLDGVFSHTGSDSVYFNREGRYPVVGAYNSLQSPYAPWYNFRNWPDDYESWWGFNTLPNVNETHKDYNQYINGWNGIVQKWLCAGADGWRLDVADELPDAFLDNLRIAAKAKKPDAVILGEVWEDASTKTVYGVRRRYLLGNQLDSVMNYPFRSAILGFLTGENAADMMEIILNVLENYPPQVIRLLMNHIGTHDTERAITALAGEPLRGHGRRWQSTQTLTKERRKKGLRLMRTASLMQFTLPGVPCIYYGDEAGMEGYRDPFNRGCYPWGAQDKNLLKWYHRLGKIRAECPCLKEGGFTALVAGDGCMVYVREGKEDSLLTAVSARDNAKAVTVPDEWKRAKPLLGGIPDECGSLFLEPYGYALLYLKKGEKQ